jgi:hypothetical protein
MKIVRVTLEIPHRWGEDAKPKVEEDRAKLAYVVDRYNLTAETDDSYVSTYLVTADIAATIMSEVGLHSYGEFGVKKIDVLLDTYDETLEKLTRIVNKLSSATLDLQSISTFEPGWNNHALAPLSGPVLHGMNDLLLLEDCCTDQLQKALDQGWRLVSVNPQEARRPDYVLGRCVAVRKYPDRGAAREID